MQLKIPVVLNPSLPIAIADLPHRELHSNLRVNISGWGKTSETTYPTYLQRLQVIALSNEDCTNRYNTDGSMNIIEADMICTYSEVQYRGLDVASIKMFYLINKTF